PSVSITAPSAGVSLTGRVTLTASASDNVGVAGVQFRLDGAALGAEVTSAPYTVGWDTTTAAPGAHTLTAAGRDAAGNVGVSTGVAVTVVAPDTTPPVISGVMVSSITQASAAITWTTNEASDTQFEYGTTTAYGSSSVLQLSLVTSHPMTLTGLTP